VTTAISSLSLHDALPIYSSCGLVGERCSGPDRDAPPPTNVRMLTKWRTKTVSFTRQPRHGVRIPQSDWSVRRMVAAGCYPQWARSEEHTSELQSLRHLVC